MEDNSGFSFENHLGKLKNLNRKSGKPLEQLVNRIKEMFQNVDAETLNHDTESDVVKERDEHHNGLLIAGCDGIQFQRMVFNKLRLGCKCPCNCVFIHNNVAILIENLVETSPHKFLDYGNFYDLNGQQTSSLGFQLVTCLSSNLEKWPFESILYQAMKLPIKDILSDVEKFAVISLINFHVHSW